MKKLFLVNSLLILTIIYIYASGGLPIPISKMNFDEYNKLIMYESMGKFEYREQFYRSLHLIFQVIAVIFSTLIPILLNSISDEKRKKKIITILSICIVIAVGASNVFKFKEQSTIYGTASLKLRKNLIEHDTNKGIFEKITNDTLKLNTYKYIAEEIIYNARFGLIEKLPDANTQMPNIQ